VSVEQRVASRIALLFDKKLACVTKRIITLKLKKTGRGLINNLIMALAERN